MWPIHRTPIQGRRRTYWFKYIACRNILEIERIQIYINSHIIKLEHKFDFKLIWTLISTSWQTLWLSSICSIVVWEKLWSVRWPRRPTVNFLPYPSQTQSSNIVLIIEDSSCRTYTLKAMLTWSKFSMISNNPIPMTFSSKSWASLTSNIYFFNTSKIQSRKAILWGNHITIRWPAIEGQ